MGRSKESETKIDLSLKLDSHDDQEDDQSHSDHQQLHENVLQNLKESDVDEAQEQQLDDIESPRISQIQKDLKTQEVLAVLVKVSFSLILQIMDRCYFT